MPQDSGRLDLADLGALEGRIRDQTLLAEYKAHDGLLQGLTVVLTTGTCLGDGDTRVGSNVLSFVTREVIQRLLRHEHDVFAALADAQRHADGCSCEGVVTH